MAALTGLTGIAGYQQQVNEDAQATPEERYGGTADEKHGVRGEQALPYPSTSNLVMGGVIGPRGVENQMLGDEWWFIQPAGNEWQDPTFDHTPSRRAAPFPKGIASGAVPSEGPDDIANQLVQSRQIHGVTTGAGLKALTQLAPVQDDWVELDELNPGHTDLTTLPKQAMSSGFMWGTRDRTQSMARQNEFGFDSAHMHRRYATGAIPGNTLWMRPGGRPLAKSLTGIRSLPIGTGSPFEGDNLGQAFSYNGAILQNVPTEYVAPPQPNLAPAVAYNGDDSVVEWY